MRFSTNSYCISSENAVQNNKAMPGHLDILLRILLSSGNKFMAALVLVAPTKVTKIIFLHFILEEG
jgi:hypothetical protein